MRCDNCLSTDTYVKMHHYKYQIKNKEIEFDAERRFCSKCNSLVYDQKLDNNAGKQAISLYNKEYGLPKEEIINLRKKYNLSQEQFSKIIGCAKKTLISYEQGKSIPNDIYMITLKTLIDNPDVIINIFDSNKERFSEKEYTVISDKLKKTDFELLGNLDKKPSIFNGFTKFNSHKLVDLILMLSEKSILKTKLLKEMFYCDFLTYKNTGASITGLKYTKFQYGPVPENYELILNKLVSSNIINYDVEYENNYECHYITAEQSIDKKEFTATELKIINQIKEYFKSYSSKDIVNFSHKEKAFIETNEFDEISYDYAFDINIEVE